MQEGSLFSTPAPAFIVCRLFDDGHSDWWEMISHCSFDFKQSNLSGLFMGWSYNNHEGQASSMTLGKSLNVSGLWFPPLIHRGVCFRSCQALFNSHSLYVSEFLATVSIAIEIMWPRQSWLQKNGWALFSVLVEGLKKSSIWNLKQSGAANLMFL